jgi:predicted MPP superfamily phosphohydrolase
MLLHLLLLELDSLTDIDLKMSETNYTNEIQILHLSDIHFGKHHICNPPLTASAKGVPSLADLIIKDLQQDIAGVPQDITDYSDHPFSPLIIAASGDFTQTADDSEFDNALKFMNRFVDQNILGRKVGKDNIYMIPGNHDVVYTETTPDRRFQPYVNFYNKFYQESRSPAMAHQAELLTSIHVRDLNGNKLLLIEINCSMYVQADTIDKSRGQVDFEVIERLSKELAELAKNPDFNDYIKIVMMHHHVVLLPAFIEDGRGVDAIQNAGFLLELLSRYNFHLILHGHKHYPQIFNYEPLPLWSQSQTKIPQLVISGGSCGSDELPTMVSTARNTYGIITVKWHPEAQQARVKVITRGLIRKSHRLLLPHEWSWETVNISDKILTPLRTIPDPGKFETESIDDDTDRISKYIGQRGMMPIAEVMPSLIPGQAYEVRAWIVEHKPSSVEAVVNTDELLEKVEWSAGKLFKKIVCYKKDNPNFSMAYHYWGPMLMEAKMTFKDGVISKAYVYARLPRDESKS